MIKMTEKQCTFNKTLKEDQQELMCTDKKFNETSTKTSLTNGSRSRPRIKNNQEPVLTMHCCQHVVDTTCPPSPRITVLCDKSLNEANCFKIGAKCPDLSPELTENSKGFGDPPKKPSTARARRRYGACAVL